MILRKPYAFFIKNFRLMHLIMTILLGYLAFETYNLLGFINGYLNDSIKYVNQVWTSTYFNNWMFIFPLIIIAMAIMIMSVLIRKKKPARFYLINISSMIFSLIYYVLVYNSMVKIETQIVDVRVMRAYKDFSIALLAIQLIAAFITFARASGFDVKKFDFGKDLKELNLQESDREEVEIEINIDTDKVKRKRNKIFRYAKYYYLENKEVYNGIFITIGIIIVISFLLDKYVYNKTYLYDNYFTASYFTMRIDNAYLVNEDYYGNKIVKEGNTLVVIKMQIKTTGKDVKQELPTAKTAVLANGKRYYPVTTYRDKLADLGITYEGQTITNTYNYYLLTYEIPNSELKNLEFNFFIGYNIGKSVEPNIVHVNLGYNDVNGTKNTSTNYLTDIVSLKDSLVDDINIKINSYELKEVFENDYYSCYKSVCIASKEYIRANYDTNYDKVLLKLNINYGVNEDKDKLKTFTELINYYGKLEYKVGDQTYYQNGNLVFITPKYNLDKNTYYIEINKDAMKADSLVLVLDIRNMNYRFKLR